MSYRNNLKKDDRVMHAETRRVGTCPKDPRETARFVAVVWQGTTSPQYVDVDKLRLVLPDGKTEQVPPYDGELPERGPRSGGAEKPAAASNGTHENPAVAAVKTRLAALEEEMRALNARYRGMLDEKKRLEQALDVLEPKGDDAT